MLGILYFYRPRAWRHHEIATRRSAPGIIFFVLAFFIIPGVKAVERHAVAVGTDSNAHIPPLRNTVHDTQALAHMLERIGIDVTTQMGARETELAQSVWLRPVELSELETPLR